VEECEKESSKEKSNNSQKRRKRLFLFKENEKLSSSQNFFMLFGVSVAFIPTTIRNDMNTVLLRTRDEATKNPVLNSQRIREKNKENYQEFFDSSFALF
jgi:hypothetical protein